MEWSINEYAQDQPRLLRSNFTVDNSLDVFVIPPSKSPTVLIKDKRGKSSNLYQTSFNIPGVSNVVNYKKKTPKPIAYEDTNCSVTFNGNCVINNRLTSKSLKEQARKKQYQPRALQYISDYYEEDDESLDSSFSCISLPNDSLFENTRSAYLPVNREHVSYLNRSIYLPTPKQIPTPRTENRAVYLPSPKRERKRTNIVDIYERASAPYTSYIVSNNNTSEESSSNSDNDNYSSVFEHRRKVSESSSDNLSLGSMHRELRDDDEIDWNNNLFDGVDSADDELEENDRDIIRSYVPYKPKEHEQPKPKHKNFKTEIGFRKKLIPLDEIMKLDLELLAELAHARASAPKASSKLINFF